MVESLLGNALPICRVVSSSISNDWIMSVKEAINHRRGSYQDPQSENSAPKGEEGVVEIMLSEKLYKKLETEADKMGVSVEELITDILSRTLNVPLDPGDRVEFHLKLCKKYLHESEELLAKGDYAQASERAWRAAMQIVKAVAAREGRGLRSHGELHREVARIAAETGDEEVRMLWQSAGMLHQNFYENWLPREMVEGNIKDVKRFVEKLRKILEKTTTP